MTCLEGTVYGGYGTTSLDLNGCSQEAATCASDVDAVAQFFIGNLNHFDQIEAYVDFVDDTPPVFQELPNDYALNCPLDLENLDASESIAAFDACSTLELDTVDQFLPGDCPNEFTRLRTFTATDGCGLTTEHLQTVEVRDEVGPVLLVPASIMFDCSEEVLQAPATAFDACSGPLAVTETPSVVVPGDCPGEYIIYREFMVEDLCGNDASGQQTIQVRDLTPPEITLPPDEVLPCKSAVTLDTATTLDNCTPTDSIELLIFTFLPPTDCPEEYIIERTFRATDQCGNSATGIQTVTVTDLDLPIFDFVPEDYSISCDEEVIYEEAMAKDDCSSFIVEEERDTVFLDCLQNYDLVRTFVVTDACGNIAEAQQTIAVRDDLAPFILSDHPDETLECGSVWEPLGLEATDQCSDVSWSVVRDTTWDSSTGAYQIAVTLFASDDCGNSESKNLELEVLDTQPPVFLSFPEDMTLSCEDPIPFEAAIAEDLCSATNTVHFDTLIPSENEGVYTVERTFVSTDAQGNAVQATQTFFIVDQVAPSFSFIPNDYTSECADALILLEPEALDNCTSPANITVLTSTETIPGNATGNFTLIRTFTATDDAGNSSLASQTITVVDTTTPVLVVPSDYSAECSDALVFDEAQATDNCSEVTIDVAEEFISGNAEGNYTIVRTFVATDDAGNSTQASQTITIEDTTPPEFIFVPSDDTAECSSIALDQASASDNCGEVTIEVTSSTIAGNAAGNYTLVRTFTATDDAGNSTEAQQTITVEDTTAPEFLFVPTDYTSECSDALILDDASVSDNCGEVTLEVSSETTAGDATGNYIVVRTFTATDDAGNSTVAAQTITVVDTTAPELVVPSDYTIECSEGLMLEVPQAEDNCGTVSLATETQIIAGNAAGNYTVLRTFTATDDAGNTNEATQTITVVDTTAPAFTSVPEDYTIECSDALILDEALASDNCSELTIEVSTDTIAGDATGNSIVVRTFTATDDAGNSTQASQTITVVDTTAPAFTSVPADYTSECSDELVLDNAMALDNCGEVSIEVSSETFLGNTASNYTLVRTFTATDDAGNSAVSQQTIIVQDTRAPTFDFFPSDVNVECDLSWPNEMPEVSDNCGTILLELETDTLPGICGDLLILERTFTATDDAGNVEVATQRLTQVDTTAPVIEWEDFVDLACSQNLNNIPLPVVSDACSDDVTLIWNDEEISGGCTLPIAQLLRTYTAFDECGNVANAEQVIQLTDNQAPVWTSLPEDQTIECTDTYEVVLPTFTDNCATPSLVWSADTLGVPNDGFYEVVFTFIASDDCDNVNLHAQT
ncbi:hypothetical protein N9D95_01970, partial [Flavobacteriales bacterium]|nr:hypothetical protein [Flavobacteriales bacterium]